MTTGAFYDFVMCGQKKRIASAYFVQWYVSLCVLLCQMLLLGVIRLVNPKFPFKSTLKHYILIGISFLYFLTFFLITISSPPDRTTPMMQAILSLSLIPFTLMMRVVILRKLVSAAKFMCTFAVIIGLAIAVEPAIFDLNEHGHHRPGRPGPTVSSATTHKTNLLWSLVFLLSFVPNATINVLQEDALQKTNRKEGEEGGQVQEEDAIHPVMMLSWLCLWNTVFMSLAFLSELLPVIGSGAENFETDFEDGMACMLGHAPIISNCSTAANVTPTASHLNAEPDPHCLRPIGRVWLQVVIFLVDGLLQLLVIKFCDGAIYMAIISSIKAPLASIFWVLFKLDSTSKFLWHPQFNMSTIYILCGLAIMVPAAVAYNLLTLKELVPDREAHHQRPKEVPLCNVLCRC